MSGPPKSKITSAISKVGNYIGWNTVGGVSSIIGVVIVVLDTFFSVQFSSYGDLILEHMDAITTLLLIFVFATQIHFYYYIDERLAWFAKMEVDSDGGSKETIADATDEALTDGGSRDLPPRDSEGKFTTQGGGGTLPLAFLGGLAGYIIAAETGAVEPIAGALIGIGVFVLMN